MSSTCKGLVLGYRRGSNEQYPRQVLVSVLVDRKSVHSLVGAKAVIRDRYGNTYIGKVVKVLGSRNSKLLVVFRRSVPGQLISRPVILEKRTSRQASQT